LFLLAVWLCQLLLLVSRRFESQFLGEQLGSCPNLFFTIYCPHKRFFVSKHTISDIEKVASQIDQVHSGFSTVGLPEPVSLYSVPSPWHLLSASPTPLSAERVPTFLHMRQLPTLGCLP